jgi:WhiB family redox-sensing transcriptional regulator
MDWRDKAACIDKDPETFYKPGRSAQKARDICNLCPVWEECLLFAMQAEAQEDFWHRYGIFGGLSGEERAQLAQEGAA